MTKVNRSAATACSERPAVAQVPFAALLADNLDQSHGDSEVAVACIAALAADRLRRMHSRLLELEKQTRLHPASAVPSATLRDRDNPAADALPAGSASPRPN